MWRKRSSAAGGGNAALPGAVRTQPAWRGEKPAAGRPEGAAPGPPEERRALAPACPALGSVSEEQPQAGPIPSCARCPGVRNSSSPLFHKYAFLCVVCFVQIGFVFP